MAVVAPPYSKERIKRAGDVLRNIDRHDDDTLTEAVLLVDEWRAAHARPLKSINANLRYYVRKQGVESEITQRLKRFSTILDKLQREPRMVLSRMEDIGGVRAILPHQDQIDAIVRDLESQPRWTIRRKREYIEGREGPKTDGYRAVHVIVAKAGYFIEIQLRTPWQDAWAQSVEQDTRRLGARLKFGAGPDDLREYYVMVSELFAIRERGEEPSQEFMLDLSKQFAATRSYFPEST
jgi:ppGpp synthetase/RelA/SpoT-type nucleotidyltranferase